jgi:hypothetical protein
LGFYLFNKFKFERICLDHTFHSIIADYSFLPAPNGKHPVAYSHSLFLYCARGKIVSSPCSPVLEPPGWLMATGTFSAALESFSHHSNTLHVPLLVTAADSWP